MKLFKRKKDKDFQKVTERSNVIQYDVMGYPLRLVILNNKEQAWLDTIEQEGDVVLRWEEESK
jgi:hypothetical protein